MYKILICLQTDKKSSKNKFVFLRPENFSRSCSEARPNFYKRPLFHQELAVFSQISFYQVKSSS